MSPPQRLVAVAVAARALYLTTLVTLTGPVPRRRIPLANVLVVTLAVTTIITGLAVAGDCLVRKLWHVVREAAALTVARE